MLSANYNINRRPRDGRGTYGTTDQPKGGVMGPGIQHILRNNAIQNNAHRVLGPPLPTSQIYQDQILSLYQVRDDRSAKAGDKGIIEEISPLPANLIFASEDVKKQIIEQPENPFKKFFLVDVEAKSAEGKVRLYRVFAVKDVLNKD